MLRRFNFLLWFFVPFACILVYLTFSFVIGMVLHILLNFFDYSNYLIVIPPYLVYIMFILVLIFRHWKDMFFTIKNNFIGVLLLSILWIITSMFIYSGHFLAGWNELGPHMYNQDAWWYLSRRSPLYPFDLWGQSFVTPFIKSLPDGYMFAWPIRTNSWIGIISYKNFVHTIIACIIQSWVFLALYNKKMSKNQISI